MAEDKASQRANRQCGRNSIRVFSQRRDEVDMNKLARVLIALARQEDNDDNLDSAKRDETP